MKRFEKYAAQHQLLREAAFAVVRREGAQQLSRRGLAAELGASEALGRRVLGEHVRLPALAAAECEARRRHAGRRRSAIDRLVPEDSAGVDVEVVWLRLRLACGVAPADDVGGDLAERYQLAVNGRVVSVAARTDRGQVEREADRAALVRDLEDHATDQHHVVAQLVGERTGLVPAVQALVDGLVLAVCTGRLSTHAARTVLLDHLETLGIDVATHAG